MAEIPGIQESKRERRNRLARERYAADPSFRDACRKRQRKYESTTPGAAKRRASKRAFYERDPEYNARYAAAHSEEAVERVRQWRLDNPDQARDRARSAAHRRRARMRNAYIEDVHALVLLERDDGVCGICGGDVDPLRFDIDHKVPLVRGGDHSYVNTQVAHPHCNYRKNSRLQEELHG